MFKYTNELLSETDGNGTDNNFTIIIGMVMESNSHRFVALVFIVIAIHCYW